MLPITSAITKPITSPLREADFSPSELFSLGEQGVWYDPTDFTTLFQDSAGTTPVTAVEQPVGLMLDKSGRGNNASQATGANRPTLSARYNLLTYSEQFDNAIWTNTNASVTANATTAPDGTTTADKLAETAVTGGHNTQQAYTFLAGVSYTFSYYAKASERGFTIVIVRHNGADNGAYINLTTGAVTNPIGTATVSATDAGNGWWRVTCTVNNATASTGYARINITSAAGTASYAGVAGNGIFVWGAQLVVTNQSSLAYQRIADAATYDSDSTKFQPYLSFNGSSQFMTTNTVDFSATDKMTVVAGLRKSSDLARGMVVELGNASTNSFLLSAPDPTAQYSYSSGGTTVVAAAVNTGYAGPITTVTSATSDIAGANITVRVNGTQAATSSASQGTGNYGTLALNIGARGGASLFFNGGLYSLIIRGAQTSQLAAVEAWVNQKTKAY